jgi:uncharacterized Tic20 family protein
MGKEVFVSQEERTMAAAAHGSILLGVLTSGVGGIFAAMIIWLTQRDKSAYVAYQAMQALVYQTSVLFLSVIGFCLWGAVFSLTIVPPMLANPELYQYSPPPTIWLGMSMLIFPCGLWLITVLYGVWGAFRTYSGDDFKYIVIGRLLDNGE